MRDLPEILIEKLRTGLRKLYGDRLVTIILFGSYARGDHDPESDVDFLICLRGEVNPVEEIKRTTELMCDLTIELGLVPSCVFISEEGYRTKQTSFLRNVRSEGVAV